MRSFKWPTLERKGFELFRDSLKCTKLGKKGTEIFREGSDARVTRSESTWVDECADEFLRLKSSIAIEDTSESES